MINIRRNIPKDEESIIDDFNDNIEIYIDGNLVKKENLNENFYTEIESKTEYPSIENSNLDNDQIDPNEFFKSSLKGFI